MVNFTFYLYLNIYFTIKKAKRIVLFRIFILPLREGRHTKGAVGRSAA